MGIHRTIDEMIEHLFNLLLDKKGFTVFSADGMLSWSHFSYGWGWGVSIEGTETVVADEALTLPLFTALVKEYHRLQQEVDGSFVGVWWDEENAKIYFDITQIYNDEQDAWNAAVAGGQVAYFDYSTMKVVKVELVKVDTADNLRHNPRQDVGFGTTAEHIEGQGTYWSKPASHQEQRSFLARQLGRRNT